MRACVRVCSRVLACACACVCRSPAGGRCSLAPEGSAAPPRLRAAPELHPSAWQDEDAAALKKKRTFRKFTFRGVDLDALLDLTSEQLMELVHARARRRFSRGLKKKGMSLVKKLRKAKKDCGAYDKAIQFIEDMLYTYMPFRPFPTASQEIRKKSRIKRKPLKRSWRTFTVG